MFHCCGQWLITKWPRQCRVYSFLPDSASRSVWSLAIDPPSLGPLSQSTKQVLKHKCQGNDSHTCWSQDSLALLKITESPNELLLYLSVIFMDVYCNKNWNWEILKLENSKTHILFAIRAKMSSYVMRLLENSTMYLKETRICHLKICLFELKIILSWRQLRSSK